MKRTTCYILCYYFPEFVRTTTLLQALQQSNEIMVYKAINHSRGWLRYWQTLTQLLFIRFRYNPDFYILGFRGYELFWPVRLITWGRPLLFDHMMSPYDSLVYEKKRIQPGSFLEKIAFRYEKGVLTFADLILTDTVLHQRYFVQLFGLDSKKIHPVHVATDEQLFTPCVKPTLTNVEEQLQVFFYGSFLPLHGIEIILQAAALVSSFPIHFTLVGGRKQDLSKFHALCAQLNLQNLTHIQWIEYNELPKWACRADLCLGGPFGNTGQARRVITGKTFQFLALGQPTVVGSIEQNQQFIHQENCLLVKQGDAQALADAIAWAFHNRAQLPQIGKNGRILYEQSFSINMLQMQLEAIFKNALLPS